MVDGGSRRPKLVGSFIRQKREAAGLSQRALGLLFTPPVTTQFISNLERGVTPLPLNHVPTLTKALNVSEAEIMSLLEREYAMKVAGRLAKIEGHDAPAAMAVGSGYIAHDAAGRPQSPVPLSIHMDSSDDLEFMRNLYEAYKKADSQTRNQFASACQNILNLVRGR